MRLLGTLLLFSCLCFAGCSAEADSDSNDSKSNGKSDHSGGTADAGSPDTETSETGTTESGTAGNDNATTSQSADGGSPGISTDVSVNEMSMDLTPANAMVEFIGTHVGEPNPRHGKFGEFTGTANYTDESIYGLNLEIQTGSLWTPIEKLTNHLKSPDFFNAREHTKATFETTGVATPGSESSEFTITGNLTLLGQTQEISFPATIAVEGGKAKLNAEFMIDRTAFGMDFGLDNVEKQVKIIFAIGETSQLGN